MSCDSTSRNTGGEDEVRGLRRYYLAAVLRVGVPTTKAGRRRHPSGRIPRLVRNIGAFEEELRKRRTRPTRHPGCPRVYSWTECLVCP